MPTGEILMSEKTPRPPVPGSTPQKAANVAARAQLRRRVRDYKRGFTVAAFVGFSAFGVLVGQSSLHTTTTSSNHAIQTTDDQSSSSSTFLKQQGDDDHDNSISTQSPATSSSTS
jgi:hypothetical protein